MGEAQDRWEGMKRRLADMNATQEDRQRISDDLSKAMYDMANDLVYPMDEEGNQLNIHWLIPMLSLHLAKCGWRKHEDEAVITQIPHPRAGQPQFAEDAVIYVPVDATGAIPPAFVSPPEDDPGHPVNDVWRTKTHVTVNGETIKGGMS